jgi:hypothetical protein
MRQFYSKMWSDDPGNPEYTKAISMLTNTMNQTAQKLRLSNSARLHRHSGVLTEKGTEPTDDNVVRDVLFGGGQTKW